MQSSETQRSAAVSLKIATLDKGQCRQVSFMTADRGQGSCAMGRQDGRLLWLPLLFQTRANHGLSHALLCRTLCMICSGDALDFVQDGWQNVQGFVGEAVGGKAASVRAP